MSSSNDLCAFLTNYADLVVYSTKDLTGRVPASRKPENKKERR